MLKLTNLNNVVTEGVTIEFEDMISRESVFAHAEFLDDVYPDRTYGQFDRGIIVRVEDYEAGEPDWHNEYFISFSDGSVWQGTHQIPGARCPEVCVMVALMDVREPYLYDEHWLTFVS